MSQLVETHSYKSHAHPYFTGHIMAAEDLATQGARASAAMVLTNFWNTPANTRGLIQYKDAISPVKEIPLWR